MKKIITTLIFAASFISSYCQQSNITDFENILNKFRYSLYYELSIVDYDKLRTFKFTDSDSIVIKINKFCRNNKQNIRNYREFKLKQYLNTKITLDDYAPDTSSFNITLNVEFDNLWEEYFNYPLANLLFINPFESAWIQITELSAHYSADSFVVQTKKDQIARPIIQTKKINDNYWEIIIDKYELAYRFEYNIENGAMKIVEVFKRVK